MRNQTLQTAFCQLLTLLVLLNSLVPARAIAAADSQDSENQGYYSFLDGHIGNDGDIASDGYYDFVKKKVGLDPAGLLHADEGYYQSVGRKVVVFSSGTAPDMAGYYASLNQGPQCEDDANNEGYYSFVNQKMLLAPNVAQKLPNPLQLANNRKTRVAHHQPDKRKSKENRVHPSPSVVVAAKDEPTEKPKINRTRTHEIARRGDAKENDDVAMIPIGQGVADKQKKHEKTRVASATIPGLDKLFGSDWRSSSRTKEKSEPTRKTTKDSPETRKPPVEREAKQPRKKDVPASSEKPAAIAKPAAEKAKEQQPRPIHKPAKGPIAAGIEIHEKKHKVHEHKVHENKKPEVPAKTEPKKQEPKTEVATTPTPKKELFIRKSDDAEVSVVSDDIVRLRHGEIVLSTPNDMIVNCGQQKIAINKNTVVSIYKDGSTLSVRNLCEEHQSSVTVLNGERAFKLYSGQELMWESDFDTLSAAAIQDGIERRGITTFEMGENGAGLICEFSEVSLIKHSPVLLPMMKDFAKDSRRVMNKVVKMAACLDVVTASHGTYAPITD